MFPNTKTNVNGAIAIVPCTVDETMAYRTCASDRGSCSKCTEDYWLQEMEE